MDERQPYHASVMIRDRGPRSCHLAAKVTCMWKASYTFFQKTTALNLHVSFEVVYFSLFP